MNAEERRLIAGLFDRLRGVENGYRDPEADEFIREQVARQPHAPYAMAQTLIVQNQALEAAQARIGELERALDETPRGPQTATPWGPRASEAMGAPAGFGGQGERDPDQDYGRRLSYGDRPFGQNPYGAPPPAAAPSRGGGFLAGALTTAAGVAGGALLVSGIQSLFGGEEAQAAGAAANAAEPQADAGAAPEDAGGGWFSGLLGGDEAGSTPPDDGGDSDWI
ncbi:DUF2076 domain-containing protein [Methylopila turkensis]|uniref:DUF2076 domain-containing protein n=1 Tax=Methylopila turkensis TaxID=1437816 RepID=A0A9W6JR96_9HYPH|nr:DUF2076 domain-containing protein [Methylopila turkensis]GLK80153.1 hypothetical protein GCM10008174_18940 [Methylopila turkensis]